MYVRDKAKYNAYMKRYILKRYKARMKEAIISLGGKCISCSSINDLELDHIERNTKSFTIGKLWSLSKERFWEEVRKCQVMCKSCHQSKSLKEMNRVSAKGQHGTVSTYVYCGPPKCTACKKAKAVYQAKRRATLA